ncbi:CPBP family intramembrane glutamic endopeptidase [Proteus alimentorum]|uniref:CPBP family intramembrane glutamic endopeptidase n=1 Tax=Proteus alimentorum TaxID=1973495 RepID=UPI00101AE9E8|nr:CPBP family intramembrane glutamic endopeptidase [Proteus alimentorum]
MQCLLFVFSAPITEEVIFRGFLLNAGMWYGNIGKWVATFILIFIVGIVFCQVRIGTRSLIAPIVLHGIHNTISVAFLML